MNLGIALVVLGIGIKSTLKMYKYINKRQYLDPLKMYPGGFYPTMNRRQAQLILGLGPGSDQTQIKQRHRALMLVNHPDNNGSTYLATKINQAKQLLLNG